jgi:hypothetical protein
MSIITSEHNHLIDVVVLKNTGVICFYLRLLLMFSDAGVQAYPPNP